MTKAMPGGFQLSSDVPGTLGVSGALNFDTAAAALQSIRTALADKSIAQLNLADVHSADSAGLSCVVEVMAEAAVQGRSLQVKDMPSGMRALAQVCEVDQLIG